MKKSLLTTIAFVFTSALCVSAAWKETTKMQNTDSVTYTYTEQVYKDLLNDGPNGVWASQGQGTPVKVHCPSDIQVDFGQDARYQIQFNVSFHGRNTSGIGALAVCNLTMVRRDNSTSLLFGNADDNHAQLGIVQADVTATPAVEVLTNPNYGNNVYSVFDAPKSPIQNPGTYTYTIIFETFADQEVNDRVYFGISDGNGLNVYNNLVDSSHLMLGSYHRNVVFDDIGFTIRGADYVSDYGTETVQGQSGVSLIPDKQFGSSFTKWTRTETRIEQPTVPEPSAFGLLAGIGALALVAARRRRSRS